MGREKFEQVLRERQQRAHKPDWESQKREWLEALDQLYSVIEGYLSKYIESGEVTVNRDRKELTEEFIGTYSVEREIVSFANERIVLDPIGTLIVGSFGRVDARGSAGTAKLVWIPVSATHPRTQGSTSITAEERRRNEQAPEEADRMFKTETRTWKIATEPPNITYLELTEETFFDLVVELLGDTAPF